MRALLKLPRRPALLWLTSSWRGHEGVFDVAPPGHLDADAEHRHVLSYYAVPQVSMVEAFQPLMRPRRRRWLTDGYFHDQVHPTALGHKMIASALLASVRADLRYARATTAMRGAAKTAAASPAAAPLPELLPPLAVPRDVAALYDDEAGAAHRVDLTVAGEQSRVVEATGFRVYEDVPSKPGLIASAVGARLVVALPVAAAALAAGSALTSATSVGYLTSYEGVGVFEAGVVTSSDEACAWPPARDAAAAVATKRVDARGLARVSVYANAELFWEMRAPSRCAWLQLTVAAAEPAREESKVKLFDVTTMQSVSETCRLWRKKQPFDCMDRSPSRAESPRPAV